MATARRAMRQKKAGDKTRLMSTEYDIGGIWYRWKIEESHFKDPNMASLTVFMACIYIKRVILYNFLKMHRLWSENGGSDVTKTT